MKRCFWAEGGDDAYIKYHDLEWGVPVTEDNTLFEFIVLESAQAGLSWKTILNKREGYKKAFKNFDPKKVAKMNDEDVARLLMDSGIVRNRLKIFATISNAVAFIKIQKEFGSFSNYMWTWTAGKPVQNKWKHQSEVPAITPLAEAMAKDLKKRGFKFLGPTIWYAHMQAVGMVNDHTKDCFRHKEIKQVATNKVF
jgi:DNA-3-methyladenine glycosylase I